jgi:putative PIN family toxin of toxin-antitoxin system
MKIVLDTNCLLKILPKTSEYRCLWDTFLRGEFELCYTTEILQEYEEVLLRFYSLKIAEFTMGTLLKSQNAIQIIPHYKWNLISTDPDDNKFVDCALNAGADFIVTNDRHFNILKNIDFPKINLIDIDAFKKMVSIFQQKQ